MIEVSTKANEKVREHLEANKTSSPIRVFLDQGGWGGPSLALALDEPKDTDETKEYNGVTYMIDKELLNMIEKVSIDFINQGMHAGFSVIPGKPLLGDGCSSCGTSCSCWRPLKMEDFPSDS